MTSNQVTRVDETELDNGVYEIEFIVDGVEYEYEINAATGQILEVDRDGNNVIRRNNQGSNQPSNQTPNQATNQASNQASNRRSNRVSNQVARQVAASPIVWIARTVDEIRQDIAGFSLEDLANYQIKWGDTLSRIAEVTGYTVEQLASYFGIQNPDLIIANYTFAEQANLAVNNQYIPTPQARRIAAANNTRRGADNDDAPVTSRTQTPRVNQVVRSNRDDDDRYEDDDRDDDDRYDDDRYEDDDRNDDRSVVVGGTRRDNDDDRDDQDDRYDDLDDRNDDLDDLNDDQDDLQDDQDDINDDLDDRNDDLDDLNDDQDDLQDDQDDLQDDQDDLQDDQDDLQDDQDDLLDDLDDLQDDLNEVN